MFKLIFSGFNTNWQNLWHNVDCHKIISPFYLDVYNVCEWGQFVNIKLHNISIIEPQDVNNVNMILIILIFMSKANFITMTKQSQSIKMYLFISVPAM